MKVTLASIDFLLLDSDASLVHVVVLGALRCRDVAVRFAAAVAAHLVVRVEVDLSLNNRSLKQNLLCEKILHFDS